MIPLVVAAGGVVRRGNAVLLVQRANDPERGRWSVPGGRVEAGERLRDAVRRELAEEVGVTVTVGDLIGCVERHGDGYHYVITDFAATIDGGAEPVAGDDAAAVAWVDLDELGEWDLVEGLGEFFADHLT